MIGAVATARDLATVRGWTCAGSRVGHELASTHEARTWDAGARSGACKTGGERRGAWREGDHVKRDRESREGEPGGQIIVIVRSTGRPTRCFGFCSIRAIA